MAIAGGRFASARGWHTRDLARAVVHGFKRHDLLTYSSALSFQILTAIVPFLLAVLALAGLLDLQELWRNHLQPQVHAHVSGAMYSVVSDAVDKVFRGQRWLWATGGGLLALWQVSGAVRAVMGALGHVYGTTGERPFARRYAISFALALEVGLCFVLAGACLLFAPFFTVDDPGLAWGVFGFAARWGLGIAFLWLAVGLLVRHAPGETEQPLPWVSFGAAVVVASWLLVSLAFYGYLTGIASYASAFGNLAVLIVLMAYLYVSTTAFFFGAQVDAILRAQATGHPAGGDTPEEAHATYRRELGLEP